MDQNTPTPPTQTAPTSTASTVVTNPNGVDRRLARRAPVVHKSWSLSASEIAEMTLAEILTHAGLPLRWIDGDSDHEETTNCLDAAVLSTRLADSSRIGT